MTKFGEMKVLRLLLCLMCMMLVTQLCYAGDSYKKKTQKNVGGASADYSKEDSTNSVSATPMSGWHFVKETTSASGSGNSQVTSEPDDEGYAEGRWTGLGLTFTCILSGSTLPDNGSGSGGGGAVAWEVSVIPDLSYSVEPTPLVLATAQQETVSGMVDGEVQGSDWRYKEDSEGVSYPENWDTGHASGYPFKMDNPGKYLLQGRLKFDKDKTASSSITVVGVKTVSAASGTRETIVSDSTSADDTNIGMQFVLKNGTAVVSAQKEPEDASWPDNQPVWSIPSGVTLVPAENPVTPGESKTIKIQQPNEYVLSVSCGDKSNKFIKVVCLDYNIQLYGLNKNGIDEVGQDRFLFLSAAKVKFFSEIQPNTAKIITTLNKSFVWSLEQVDGVTGSNWIPYYPLDAVRAYGVGLPSSTKYIQLQVLPASNKGLGVKKLELALSGFGVEPISRNVRLFYDMSRKTHPDPGNGSTPNWYYYWSKEGNPAVCSFSRDLSDSQYAAYWNTTTAYGKYASGKIYISDKAANSTGFSYSFPEGSGASSDWVRFSINTTNGPETVNLTHAHESTHKMADSWGSQTDSDGDGIPDTYEAAVPGMNILNKDSFGNNFKLSGTSGAERDEEFYCVLGGAYTFGSITDSEGENATVTYYGVKPEAPTIANDWSKGSINWNN